MTALQPAAAPAENTQALSVPGSLVDAQSRRRSLLTAIERLAEKERLVLALFCYENLTVEEISRVLDLAESDVLGLHATALKQLGIELEDGRNLTHN